jgi:hypothetical protein
MSSIHAQPTHCVACGLALANVLEPTDRNADGFRLQCVRCGTYEVSGTLAAGKIGDATSQERTSLVAALRDAHENNRTVFLRSDNWRMIAAPFAAISIPEKLRRLLEYLGRKSADRAGLEVRINSQHDYPLFGAADESEYHWLRQTLFAQGLIKERDNERLILTLQGWEAFRPSRGGTPGTCFVAMAFDQTLDEAYDSGIHPAVVEDNRYSIIRIDRVPHNENINDRIIADIRACQFMVADFTLHRNGVYFEAGFAKGLGREVIWTCRDDEFRVDKVHFDTRPYNHIVWNSSSDLREKLSARIAATIAR